MKRLNDVGSNDSAGLLGYSVARATVNGVPFYSAGVRGEADSASNGIGIFCGSTPPAHIGGSGGNEGNVVGGSLYVGASCSADFFQALSCASVMFLVVSRT